MTGELTQKAGVAGCISEDGSGGNCADGTGLGVAIAVAVSPDGAHVYVASFSSSAVVAFDRDLVTGALTQSSCVSEAPIAGCADGKALSGAISVAVSPDGAQVYVASWTSSAVAVFDRNPGTGVLTQKTDPAGCINDGGSLGCTTGHDMVQPFDVTVSPDGLSAYLGAFNSSAIIVLDRNSATGALTQRVGPTGCISDNGSGGACLDGTALGSAAAVVVSPGSGNVYGTAFGSDSVVVLDRSLFSDGFESGDTTIWSSSAP
jgi:DNA-binding beta-propeller fold protein YncE